MTMHQNEWTCECRPQKEKKERQGRDKDRKTRPECPEIATCDEGWFFSLRACECKQKDVDDDDVPEDLTLTGNWFGLKSEAPLFGDATTEPVDGEPVIDELPADEESAEEEPRGRRPPPPRDEKEGRRGEEKPPRDGKKPEGRKGGSRP